MMDVGIDVGGTNLRAGVVDEQGKLLSRVSQPVGTLKSPEELIRRLAELAQKAVEDAGTPENQIQSVGVGIPGAVSEGNTEDSQFCHFLYGFHRETFLFVDFGSQIIR